MGTILAFIGLISLISIAVYGNIDLHKRKKNGTFTKEDQERLDEEMKIW
ncbi:hypothetical protein [Lysinibacillus sp. FW12]